MKRVIADASSAILLHRADALTPVLAAFEFCVTPSVYAELTHHPRPGARVFTRECRERRITLMPPPCAPTDHLLPANLHRGERDTLLCYLDGGADFVIIDDGRGAGYCRQAEIPYINALLCPRVLALSGRLCPLRARAAMTRLGDIGRYSEGVIQFAWTCAPGELSAFLP